MTWEMTNQRIREIVHIVMSYFFKEHTCLSTLNYVCTCRYTVYVSREAVASRVQAVCKQGIKCRLHGRSLLYRPRLTV